MVNLGFENSCQSISDPDIDRVQSLLNVEFPESYKRFLKQHNGGEPKLRVFPIIGDSLNPFGMIRKFVCLEDGNEYGLTWQMSMYEDRIPKHFLIIAKDDGSNNICLSVGDDDYGKIYFWDHEGEVEEGEEPDYRNVYLIANSFDEFLESLQDESVLESQS